jgi:hypothetical protein
LTLDDKDSTLPDPNEQLRPKEGGASSVAAAEDVKFSPQSKLLTTATGR